MSRSAIALAAWVLVAALLALPCRAEDPPFTGVVTSDDVNVRAGAGETFYSVGTVKSGERVRVQNILYEWYEIDPLPGSFSYIARDLVKLDPDGKSGVVTDDRVRVRAPAPGGPEPSVSFKVQLRLDKGQAVGVLGEAGEFLKIVPPPGVRVYIKKDFVRPATETELASAEKPQPQTPAEPKPREPSKPPKVVEKPAAPKVDPTPKPEPKPDPVPPAVELPEPRDPAAKPADVLVVHLDAEGKITLGGEAYEIESLDEAVNEALADNPDLKAVVRSDRQTENEAVAAVIGRLKGAGIEDVSVAALDPVEAEEPAAPETDHDGVPAPAAESEPRAPRLEDLERRFADLTKKKLIEQPIGELRVEYETLMASDALSPTDRALVKARLDMLDHRRDLQSRLGDVQAFRQQLETARKERDELEKLKPKRYAAVGRLHASTLYTGDKLPLLYRVSDPSTGLTVAYVQPPTRAEDDYAVLVGQYVGVTGDKEYDPTLKLDVVKAKEIDVLTPKE